MMAALEGSLKRLRTDYLDIYFTHAVNDVRRMQNPEWREFTERAGSAFAACRLAECLDYAIDADLVDVVLVAYSFGQNPDFYDRRARMYAVDYRDQALALEDYAKLEERADACLGCAHQACLGACPFGLPIPRLTRDAATRLG